METIEMAVSELTVRDIMQSEVFSVEPELTVGELIKLFMTRDISGAPVVNRDGAVVGVVSTTDILRYALEEAEVRAESVEDFSGQMEGREGEGFYMTPEGTAHFPMVLFPGLPGTRLAARPVRDIMTSVTFSVRPDATLPELARFLLQGKIHRALVFDHRHLVGLVTTLDLVRAIADSAG
jgi:CBS domain-containing protein